MTHTDGAESTLDLIDLEPSDDEIVDEEIVDVDEDDGDEDFSYAAIDDRWNDSGVPSWSAFA